MDNVNPYSAEELQKCPFHSQQNAKNSLGTAKDTRKEAGRPDESGTDPKRYEPQKFEKGSNESNFQNSSTDPKSTGSNSNPYDSEKKDLIENDPSQGFETDMDTPQSNEAEIDTFKTIAPEKGNPVNKEFEIGHLDNEELKEDELTRDASRNGAPGNTKPSQRKF